MIWNNFITYSYLFLGAGAFKTPTFTIPTFMISKRANSHLRPFKISIFESLIQTSENLIFLILSLVSSPKPGGRQKKYSKRLFSSGEVREIGFKERCETIFLGGKTKWNFGMIVLRRMGIQYTHNILRGIWEDTLPFRTLGSSSPKVHSIENHSVN